MSVGHVRPADVSLGTLQAHSALHHNTHSVHFYEEDSFLIHTLAELIGTALVDGDIPIVVATPEHRNGLANSLRARGIDLDLAAKHGRYYSFDAAETLPVFMVNGTPDPALFNAFMDSFLGSVESTLKGGSQRLVIFGEMVALLWSEGNFDAALKLERLWNDLARTHSFHLHCAYPMKGFDRVEHAQAFHQLCAEHSHIIPTENYTALSSEEDRLRTISMLQQRACAAESEASGRRRAEEALRHSEKLAATGRLAASIAHEINNPLETISNAIYLARSSSREDIAKYLKIADEELARVAQITKHTLGFYRESATPGIVSLSAVLDELLLLYSRKIETKGLALRRQYRGELEVWGLEGELRQVFANQIANAIYATPRNGALTIRIRASASVGRNQRAGTVVTLADTGSGIPQESVAKIFDPFFTTKQDVGNGLGLWITQGIITRHGGTIRVRSSVRPGASGTVFSTFLPHRNGDTPTIS